MTTRPSPPILSQGLLSMGAYGVNFVASFFAVIGIIRLLDKEEWGLFALAIQIVAFTSMIADFGIGPVIMRRLAIAPGRALSILLEATLGRGLLLLPTWIVSLLIGWQLEPDWSFMLLLNVMLVNMVISSKVPVLRGSLEALFRSQSRMGLPAVTMAVDSMVLLAAVLVIPASFSDPLSAMMLYTASNVLGGVILLVTGTRFARRLNTEPVRVSWTGMRELVIASAPLALYLLLNALHVTIDSIYLKYFHGAAEVGLFNAALRIMTPLAVFPTIIAISVAPHFARASVAEDDEQRARLTRLFSLSVKTVLIGSVLMAGLGLTNAAPLLGVAFGGKFDDAALPMALLFVAFLPMALNIFMVEVNNARGRLAANTRFSAITAGVSVSLGALLVWRYGASGAAAAKLLAVLAGLVYLLARSRVGIAVAMKPVIAKSLLLFLLLVAVRLLLTDFGWPAANLAALAVFAAGIVVLKMFSAEELGQWRTQLASLVGRRVRSVRIVRNVRSGRGGRSGRSGRSGRNGRSERMSEMNAMDFSNVTAGILSYNRREDLRRTLHAVLAIPGLRVLVIDNASSDGTLEMLRDEFNLTDPHTPRDSYGALVRAVPRHAPNAPHDPHDPHAPNVLRLEANEGIAARNRFIELVDTEYMLSLDDDSWPRSAEDVALMVETMESDPRIASVCASCVHPDTGVAETRGIERFASAGDAGRGYDVVNIAAGGSLLRMAAMRETRGYGEEFFWGREENDLAFQLLQRNWRVVFQPRAVVWHALSPAGRRQYERLRYVTRNSLWLLWKYFPLAVALPASALFVLRRLLPIVKDPRRTGSVLGGIVTGYGGIAARRRLPSGTRRFTIAESVRLRGWFLKLLYE